MKLEPCPNCGGAEVYQAMEYAHCFACKLKGPQYDPDGSLWNDMCKRLALPRLNADDAELLAAVREWNDAGTCRLISNDTMRRFLNAGERLRELALADAQRRKGGDKQ